MRKQRQTLLLEDVAAVLGSVHADPWVMVCREIPDPREIDIAIELLQLWRNTCERYHARGKLRRRDWSETYDPSAVHPA